MAEQAQSDLRAGRSPDWPAAATAGFAAGAILMVLDLFWSTAVTGVGPWKASRMIAAVFLGPETLQETGFAAGVIVLALVAHYSLGVMSGLVLAAITTKVPFDATLKMTILTGTVFGIVIYLVNFHALASLFPWFAEIRGGATFIAHLVFGISTAVMYWKLERRGEAEGA